MFDTVCDTVCDPVCDTVCDTVCDPVCDTACGPVMVPVTNFHGAGKLLLLLGFKPRLFFSSYLLLGVRFGEASQLQFLFECSEARYIMCTMNIESVQHPSCIFLMWREEVILPYPLTTGFYPMGVGMNIILPYSSCWKGG